MWNAKEYFAGRWIRANTGQKKWWFLVGGTVLGPKIRNVDVDGCPTRAVRVRERWKNMLEKAQDPVIAYAHLTQHLPDNSIWESFFPVWEAHRKHENQRDFNRIRSQKRSVSYKNPYRSPSVRECASRSIV